MAEVYLFFLERLEETFGLRVIIRTARFAHARAGPNLAQAGYVLAALAQAGYVLAACILNASIRMMDQARWIKPDGSSPMAGGERQWLCSAPQVSGAYQCLWTSASQSRGG
jgi:hypothetical protein